MSLTHWLERITKVGGTVFSVWSGWEVMMRYLR